MSISDVIRNKFVEEFTAISVGTLVTTMLLSFLLGLFVLIVYRLTYSGPSFSKSFALSLVMLSMVTALAILTVRSNVVLSLGMVGALSIVRFRTAIKEPLDIAFLFWAIAGGIVLAAGMLPLAIFGSVLIGVIILIFANRRDMSNPYIVVLRCDGHDSEAKALEFLGARVRKYTVKSKTAQRGLVELNLEIRMKDDNTDFVNELSEIGGVESAVLVSYNGDYMG